MKTVKPLITKVSIFFISLILFLGILEFSLRVAGRFWQHQRTDYVSSGSLSSEDKIVACFGDSYTVGGLGLRETSYPAFLSEKCKKNNIKVLNLGICESNTSQVLEAIKNYTDYRKIETIVFLAGAANKYNFYGMKRVNFYQNMRLYKMFHMMILAIKNKNLKKEVLKEFNDNPNTGYCLTPDIQKIISDIKRIDETEGKIIEIGKYLSQNNTHIPFQNFYKSSESVKYVLDILDTIPNKDKEKFCFDMLKIYAAIDDDEKVYDYYNIAKKINPLKAAESFCKKRFIRKGKENDKRELDIFDELIKFDKQKGYAYLIKYNMNGLFFIKGTEHNRRLNIIKKYIPELENMDNMYPETKEILFDFYCITGDFEKADKFLSEILKNNEKTAYRYVLNLAYYCVYYKKYDKAVGYFLEAFKINPYIDMHCYYYFAKSYRLQSSYDAAYISSVLKEIENNNLALKNDPSFVSVVKLFSESSSFEKEILNWIESDLNQIIQICNKKNIKLFIQNYPFPYTEINRKLKNIAKSSNISFIDNFSVFQKLVKKNGFSRYFLDFDHCTEEGHKVIAQNVYNALNREGVINEK